MNASLSLSTLTGPLSRFFGKYHATIFFTFITLLLAGAILSLYLTASSTASQDAESVDIINSSFDQSTAKEIQTLRESNETTSELVYPSSRSNPFVE